MDKRRTLAAIALIGLFGLTAIAPLAALAPPSEPSRPSPERAALSTLERRTYDFSTLELLDAGDVAGSAAGLSFDGAVTTFATDAKVVPLASRGVQLTYHLAASDAAAPPEPAAEPEDPALTLLLVASQQTVALLGLAPHPGVAPPLPQPDAGLSVPMALPATGVALAASVIDVGEAPGWLRQAAWTVALAAFGILALRGIGLAFALFSRFERDELLGHERRAKLFEAIRADPGIAFGRLRDVSGWAPGVVQHHLRLLEQHGVVRRVRDGRTTHFFPAGPRPAPTVALAPARRGILELLRAEPGLSLGEVAQKRGHTTQTVWDHLDRLRSAGLVEGARKGRGLRWSLATGAAW